jgi:hypothetical protein
VIARVVIALAVLAGASPVLAQTPIQFFPRYDFHVDASHLSSDSPRYVWDADFGAEIDVVDYRLGRFTFWANYQVVMGEQLRAFDPNQGNYILAGSTSARLGGFELAGVFYHQSRHLADRPKIAAVAWNMMGGRVIRAGTAGRTQWHASADLWRTVERAFVDYEWEFDSNARIQVGLSPRVAFVSAGNVRVLGVDGTVDRGTQTGYLAEGGVRFAGGAGAVELFVAAERRIDPFPVEFGTENLLKAGFRLVSR